MVKFFLVLSLGLYSALTYADLVDQNSAVPNNRLVDLVKQVQGGYEAPRLDPRIREQAKIVNNEDLARRYGSQLISEKQRIIEDPQIGMTKQQVQALNTTWSNPLKKHVRQDQNNIYEYWYYSNGVSLTFKNGVLDFINTRLN